MLRLQCPRCGTVILAEPGTEASCPNCHYTANVPEPPPKRSTRGRTPSPAPPSAPEPPLFTPSVPAPPPFELEPPPARERRRRKQRPGLALLVNLVLPGAGTAYGGRPGEGALQVFLLVIGIVTAPFLFGLALVAGAWTWGVVSGVQLLLERGGRRAQNQRSPIPPS